VSSFAAYPSLHGRGVLVTGGASGIGRAVVENFAAQGSRVAFLDYDRTAGEATAAATGAAFVFCDLRDIAALRAAVEQARAAAGPFTVLVNNAARDDRHDIEELTPDYFDERVAINFRHVPFATQAVLADMKAAGGGAVVNFSSISWVTKNERLPIYEACKAACWGLTRGLARDLGKHRIRVNCVFPGWVKTERQLALWHTPEAERQNFAQQCLGEWVLPDDLARMVLFLSADDSRMITSQSFTVDGGRT